MDTKEVKAGEKYKLELLCIYNTGTVITFETPTGNHLHFVRSDLECVSPAAPKYEPCRKFRMGDEVRVIEWNGRLMFNEHSKVFKCSQNEHKNGLVPLKMTEDDITHLVHACHLELLTPVEELEPYSVLESGVMDGFDILRDKLCVMTFPYGSKEGGYYRNKLAAKEAAEAERDRLNAEYRKEMKND